MEHLKTYYSIEKHLEETSKINPKFEILDAIWKLNKRNLASALANVNQYYPHFSLHEKSHSTTIINNIESFLGEERIKKLSPTNAWLILMSSFTHDLGMIVFHDLIEKEWLTSDFQHFLKEISEWDDIEMRESGKNLLLFQDISNGITLDPLVLLDLSPLKIKNAVTLAVSEYIRRVHHKRSAEILSGVDKVFYEVANSFYSDQIPNRLLNILAEVAYLHGVEFYEIFKRLDYESNGISNDKINPRFISALLRLGDLLDVDDTRFNSFSEKVFKYPKNSLLHKQKHSSIKHLLITPEAIEITSDCPTEEVYRLARSWFDWLEDEVEKQSKEWSNIAPRDLGGSSPTIPKGKIKVYYNSIITDDKLLNLRFEISNKKIFEILEGSSIYEKAEFTFLRELVQNALDASKIQLWTEIERGAFDFVFKDHFKDKSLTHKQILEKIRFPSDIPDLLNESFEVKLSVQWETQEQNALIFSIEDQGTGISNNDLLRMTNKVGESRKSDSDYQRMLTRMPFWLRPTGAFGIGLQSVFIVSDSFKVQTKTEGSSSKEIIFRSAKKGKYSSISGIEPEMGRGTKVIVQIPQEKFYDVFGTSFDWNIVQNYDYFTDEHQSIHIPKIKAYINDVFANIGTLRVDFFGKELFIKRDEQAQFKEFPIYEDADKNIQCRLLLREHDIYFLFYENIIGSEFIIHFFTDYEKDIENDWPSYSTKYFVRDIPVKDNTINYYKLSFSKLYWNFMSPESDKILSLTREKFVSKKKAELQAKFLNKIVPGALKLAEKSILLDKPNVTNNFSDAKERLAYGYFKFLLTKKINIPEALSIDQDLIGDFVLPITLVSYIDKSPVKMKDFFSAKDIYVPKSNQHMMAKSFINESKLALMSSISSDIGSDSLIIWNNGFFGFYLSVNFHVNELFYSNDGVVIRLGATAGAISVKTGKEIYLKLFLSNAGISNRSWYYAIDEYAKDLAIDNKYASGFEHFPYLSKHSIISPFKDMGSYNDFRQRISEITDLNHKENVLKALSDNLILELLTDTLIDWVITNRPDELAQRDRQMVINSYKHLIADLIINS